jgi:ATP dependent DNA ligase domain
MKFQPAIPTPRQERADRFGVDSRDQIRRLPPDRSSRQRSDAAAHNGFDWSGRYPWIAEAALKNRSRQFVIDGEAVVLGVDGISDFEALYSHKHDDEVQLYAFDVLAMDGDDMRQLPLSMRNANVARLLRGRPDGIFVAPFEHGDIGPTYSEQPAIWVSRA